MQRTGKLAGNSGVHAGAQRHHRTAEFLPRPMAIELDQDGITSTQACQLVYQEKHAQGSRMLNLAWSLIRILAKQWEVDDSGGAGDVVRFGSHFSAHEMSNSTSRDP